MTRAGYNKTLVEAIRGLLTDTEIVVNGETIKTLRGTPQGSCLSPDLWNIYIAQLCRDTQGFQAGNLNAFVGLDNAENGSESL